MIKFLFARHRKVYIKLAIKHLVWPERVYILAHKGSSHNDLDRDILHDLLDEGILHRRHKINMEHYDNK